jgi:hypothetical protein
MSQPKNRKRSGEGGVRDAEFLRVDFAGVSDQRKEKNKNGETDLSPKTELHFCTQPTTARLPIEHVHNHNVKNSLRPCCSKVIRSGVNDKVIMSGWGDDNSDGGNHRALQTPGVGQHLIAPTSSWNKMLSGRATAGPVLPRCRSAGALGVGVYFKGHDN